MLDPSLFVTTDYKQGTPNTDQVRFIFNYLQKRYSFNSILEIGFLKGHSATWFMETFPKTKLTSVDNVVRLIDGEQIYKTVKQKYYPRFKFHYGDSSIIKDIYQPGSFDFAYIDGDHTFEGCLKDLDMCLQLKIPVILLDNVERTVDSITNELKDGVSRAISMRRNILKFKKQFTYTTANTVNPGGKETPRIMELYHVLYDDI